MRTRLLSAVLAASVLIAGPLAAAASAKPDQADAVETFARDVFVIVGSTLRNPTDTTPPNAPLFNNAGVSIEDPAGVPVTWGQWSAATATSRASTIGGPDGPRTDFRIELSGLLPGAVYSIFWGTLTPDSEQPLCPGVERTLPLDATQTSASLVDPNSFVADASGTVSYRGRAPGALLDAYQAFVEVVYHLTGQTAYPFPNIGEQRTQGPDCRSSFGEDAMRQLLILQS